MDAEEKESFSLEDLLSDDFYTLVGEYTKEIEIDKEYYDRRIKDYFSDGNIQKLVEDTSNIIYSNPRKDYSFFNYNIGLVLYTHRDYASDKRCLYTKFTLKDDNKPLGDKEKVLLRNNKTIRKMAKILIHLSHKIGDMIASSDKSDK